jgi:uncharacterized membrane-anchored protein YitT (DUF2179 family)
MELTTIFTYVAYGIVALCVVFAAYVFLSIYQPKPKEKKVKVTKKEAKQEKQTQPKVINKGKKQVVINTDGDIISLSGQVSETESSSKIKLPNED